MLAQQSFLITESPSESDCYVLECVHTLLSLLTLAVIDCAVGTPAAPLTDSLASRKQLADCPHRRDPVEIVHAFILFLRSLS